MDTFIFLLVFGLALFGFNWLMGYRKGHITIDFDERYLDFKEYITAIKAELTKQGKEVHYQGNRVFIIDGGPYIFIERNVSMGGAPLQRTILKPTRRQSLN